MELEEAASPAGGWKVCIVTLQTAVQSRGYPSGSLGGWAVVGVEVQGPLASENNFPGKPKKRQVVVQHPRPRKQHLPRMQKGARAWRGRVSNRVVVNSLTERVWTLACRQWGHIQELKLNRKMMKHVFWKVCLAVVNSGRLLWPR
jgi:hypothetical protein